MIESPEQEASNGDGGVGGDDWCSHWNIIENNNLSGGEQCMEDEVPVECWQSKWRGK